MLERNTASLTLAVTFYISDRIFFKDVTVVDTIMSLKYTTKADIKKKDIKHFSLKIKTF